MMKIYFAFWACICALALSACSETDNDLKPAKAQAYTVQFAPTFDTQPAQCDTEYVLDSSTSVELRDFRLYISEISIADSDGSWHPVKLDTNEWQLPEVALLDFEDATGLCSEIGDPQTRTIIEFESVTAPTGLRFTLGVPFELNHTDIASAPDPLNIGAMQWNWQIGRKFLRVDFQSHYADNNTTTSTGFNVHLGSTGCESLGATQSPTAKCMRSNRIQVEFSQWSQGQTIDIDAFELIRYSDTNTNTTDTAPGCQSQPFDPDCNAVFEAINLDTQTGNCGTAQCADQRLFSLQ